MRRLPSPSISLYAALSLAVALPACGKKSDDDDKEETPSAVGTGGGTAQNTGTNESTSPGVTAATGNDLILSGQLALSGLGLAETAKAALVYQFSLGEVIGFPAEVAVDDNGKFSATVPKADAAIELLVTQAALPREQRDWDKMATTVMSVMDVGREITGSTLQNMSEQEIQDGVGEIAKSMQSAGRMTLIVAYDKSGDKVAEAQSFRFIGLQTPGGKNLSGLPNSSLKGNVNLGKITGAGADVTSEVKASDALDISSSALETFADMGRILKSVKNDYMNTKWSVTPFYFWNGNSNGHSNLIDQWSDVAASTYHGYGFYVPSNGDQGLSQADVCGGKPIEFIPPGGSLTLKNPDSSLRTTPKFTNTGTSVGNSDTCNGGTDYYARRDERDGQVSYMLNFGTGGSIQNSPEGLWTMKVDGAEVGHFDLASSMPVDANRKPLVFIPRARFNSSNGNIVSVDVELHRWTGSAYEKVTDLDPVRRLFKAFEVSITTGQWPNTTEHRSKITIQDDGSMRSVFDGSRIDNGQTLNNPVAVNSITQGFAIYYEVGNASYRIEFR